MPCKQCAELQRQLKESWETILRMDGEIKLLSDLVNGLQVQLPCEEPKVHFRLEGITIDPQA